MFAPVYFDHNATTPLLPEVREAMLPWLAEQFGNASSRHEYGRSARRAIDEARARVAAAVGAHESEIVFTASGTEADNLFIKGAAACQSPGLVAVSAIEHPAVLRSAEQLAKRGWSLQKIAVDANGQVDERSYLDVIVRKPALVSIMLANNETGVIQNIAALAAKAKGSRGYFHTDAVQALGKIALDFRALNAEGVHAMTLSAHKIGGSKGAAALVLDKRVELEALIAGGGQERGLRSGTENVAAIVGFGVACELAANRLAGSRPKLIALRERVENGLAVLGATMFGAAAERLPNTVFFALPQIEGETLVAQLDRAGFALASGSACSSAQVGPSHVLEAMGVTAQLSRGAVRISFGLANTPQQVDNFLFALQTVVKKMQRLTAIAV